MPQLCAYIFVILSKFSGICNRLFQLNILYFRRKHRLINQMWTYSLCHKSAMRPPHVCYVIRACDGRSDRKHCFRSTCAPALLSQFWNVLDQLESRTSPSHSAETSQVCHLHDNRPFHHITEASSQKILLYMDRIVRHWFVLHSKNSFNTVKIQLTHSTPCTTFFRIVSLTFLFFPLFENFNYDIYLKKHVYKVSLQL